MAFNLNESNPAKTHTTLQFIAAGVNNKTARYYQDFSYIETIDGKYEFIVKNVLDDYLAELKENSIKVNLTSDEIRKYKYNPKLLSYDLYKTTILYHVILKLNNIADIHQFNLSKGYIYLIPRSIINDILSKIYNSDKVNIQRYNSNHRDDKQKEIVDKFK